MDRLFDRAEANALLPTLIPILEEAQRLVLEMSEHQETLMALRSHIKLNGHAAETERLTADVERIALELTELVERIQDMGIELKDVTTGLVDFPGRIQGRLVYLCWRLGEPEVAFWHDIDAGIAGRQPLGEGE